MLLLVANYLYTQRQSSAPKWHVALRPAVLLKGTHSFLVLKHIKSCASHQELAQLQSSQHALEQTLNQTKSKLTQEIQQAKKDHNMLEAEMEKVRNMEEMNPYILGSVYNKYPSNVPDKYV